MTHDPLCPYADRVEDEALRNVPCGICELIAKVRDDEARKWSRRRHDELPIARADMLAKCIAAIEEMPYYYMRSEDDGMGSTHGAIKANTIKPLLETSKVVAALRALQDGEDNVVQA